MILRWFAPVAALLSLSILAAPAAATDDEVRYCDHTVAVENQEQPVELVVDEDRCRPRPGGPCHVDGRPGVFDRLGRCRCFPTTTTTVPPVVGPQGPQGPQGPPGPAGETVVVEVPVVETVVVERDMQPAIPATPRRGTPTFTG